MLGKGTRGWDLGEQRKRAPRSCGWAKPPRPHQPGHPPCVSPLPFAQEPPEPWGTQQGWYRGSPPARRVLTAPNPRYGVPLGASEPAPDSNPRLSAPHQPHGVMTQPWPWVKNNPNPNWAGGQCSLGCLEQGTGGSPSPWVLKSKLDAAAKETGGLIKMSPFRP